MCKYGHRASAHHLYIRVCLVEYCVLCVLKARALTLAYTLCTYAAISFVKIMFTVIMHTAHIIIIIQITHMCGVFAHANHNTVC